jgi:hypothetical protein
VARSTQRDNPNGPRSAATIAREPATREDSIPTTLCRSQCASGPSHDPRRYYLGSPEWSRDFARFLTHARVPWYRHPYAVAYLRATDPQGFILVSLSHAHADANDLPLIEAVPAVARACGLRPLVAWKRYLAIERRISAKCHLAA